jgi:hypothetical protein
LPDTVPPAPGLSGQATDHRMLRTVRGFSGSGKIRFKLIPRSASKALGPQRGAVQDICHSRRGIDRRHSIQGKRGAGFGGISERIRGPEKTPIGQAKRTGGRKSPEKRGHPGARKKAVPVRSVRPESLSLLEKYGGKGPSPSGRLDPGPDERRDGGDVRHPAQQRSIIGGGSARNRRKRSVE